MPPNLSILRIGKIFCPPNLCVLFCLTYPYSLYLLVLILSTTITAAGIVSVKRRPNFTVRPPVTFFLLLILILFTTIAPAGVVPVKGSHNSTVMTPVPFFITYPYLVHNYRFCRCHLSERKSQFYSDDPGPFFYYLSLSCPQLSLLQVSSR